MRRRYMDAMALVRKYGKPDIFLTMMCNPNWDEIKNELYPGQTPQDHPDLVTRVFRAKLEAMRKMLMEKDILGKVNAYVYVVALVPRIHEDSSFVFPIVAPGSLVCEHERNGYRRFLPVNIYLSRITERSIK